MGATKLAAVKTIVSKVNFKVTCKGKKLTNMITKGILFIFILILSMISINVIIKMVTNINNINIYIHIVHD